MESNNYAKTEDGKNVILLAHKLIGQREESTLVIVIVLSVIYFCLSVFRDFSISATVKKNNEILRWYFIKRCYPTLKTSFETFI